jgi:hypothetical protein
MPPSLLDGVPEDHLVWTILDAVEEMDLSAFVPTIAPTGTAARRRHEGRVRFVTRAQGRRAPGCARGRRALEERRASEARPVPRSRPALLEEAARRLEEELVVERQANAAYEAWRRRGVARDGTRRMPPGSTTPYRPPELPAGTINTTDADSRLVKTLGQRRSRATTRTRRSTKTRSASGPPRDLANDGG